MPRLPVLKPREVMRTLERLGFVEVRQRGAHRQFRHPDGRGTTVPSHSGRDIAPPLLREMAGLGKWAEDWKESVKASVFHGSEKFVAGMLKELKGDRREQTGMREKERLSLEWSRIVAAIAKVWKAPWEVVSRQRGKGAVGLAYYLGQRHA
jgi:predicted RNA binding protein YcfA (HicA-like mRNA interferase family)